jgi:hypothetical protein
MLSYLLDWPDPAVSMIVPAHRTRPFRILVGGKASYDLVPGQGERRGSREHERQSDPERRSSLLRAMIGCPVGAPIYAL